MSISGRPSSVPGANSGSAIAAPELTYAELWSPEQFDAAYARSETAKDDIKIIRQFFAVRTLTRSETVQIWFMLRAWAFFRIRFCLMF